MIYNILFYLMLFKSFIRNFNTKATTEPCK